MGADPFTHLGGILTAEGPLGGEARPWPAEWDLVVMHLLATGLVELSRILEQGRAFPVPYPASLQRGLDRLTVMCAVAGAEPPRSIMDLARWAQLPFGSWPWRPRVGCMGDEERLLAGASRRRRVWNGRCSAVTWKARSVNGS